MLVSLQEPHQARYIYINSLTNKVHLLVPFVAGREISTDNTCKSAIEMENFFKKSALLQLQTYKIALEFDISILNAKDALRIAKEERLTQIEAYIEGLKLIAPFYQVHRASFLKKPSNLYGMRLRPASQDSQIDNFDPTFNITRYENSCLFNEIDKALSCIIISIPNPRTQLIKAVLESLDQNPSFENIQQTLQKQCLKLFDVLIDFTQEYRGKSVTKEKIDKIMRFDENTTPQDYTEALISACALHMFDNLQVSPFYNVRTECPQSRTESLSIVTQFFLATVNIYCKIKNLSDLNFGVLLDNNLPLTKKLLSCLAQALAAGNDVEKLVCNFLSENRTEFGLVSPLLDKDITEIKQRFMRTYNMIAASPHKDEFLVLDLEATGENAKFVYHQGAICMNFAEMAKVTERMPNMDYFDSVLSDFKFHPNEIPATNKYIANNVHIKPEIWVKEIQKLNPSKVPQSIKNICAQLAKFLVKVSLGQQQEAQELLSSPDSQILLITPGGFTDSCGHKFNCSAYEYAYWSRNSNMCKMLAKHMNAETKSYTLELISKIEKIDVANGGKNGLKYKLDNKEYKSSSFDLTPLKSILSEYIKSSSNKFLYFWNSSNKVEAKNILMQKAKELQKKLPEHILATAANLNAALQSEKPEYSCDKAKTDIKSLNKMEKQSFKLMKIIDMDSQKRLCINFV